MGMKRDVKSLLNPSGSLMSTRMPKSRGSILDEVPGEKSGRLLPQCSGDRAERGALSTPENF